MGLVVTLFISRAGLPYPYDIGSILRGDLECFFILQKWLKLWLAHEILL